jgi:hypothetical protein
MPILVEPNLKNLWAYIGATTLSIMTLNMMTLNIMTLNIMTFSIITLGVMAFSIIINIARHSAQWQSIVILSVICADGSLC